MYDNDTLQPIDDYSRLANIASPRTQQEQRDESSTHMHPVFSDSFFYPEELAPPIQIIKENVSQAVENWVQIDVTPDFPKWIETTFSNTSEPDIKGQWTALFQDSTFTEDTNLAEVHLQLIGLLVNGSQWKILSDAFNEISLEYTKRLFDHSRLLFSSPETHTYTSMKDLVWMHWIKEDYSNMLLYDDEDILSLQKCVCEVVEHTQSQGDQYYFNPSLVLRKGLNIQHTDYLNFTNPSGNTICFSHRVKQSLNEQTLLFARSEELQDYLQKEGKQLFWIGYEYRNGSTYYNSSVDGNHYSRRARIWFIWKENGHFRKKLFHQGEFFNI